MSLQPAGEGYVEIEVQDVSFMFSNLGHVHEEEISGEDYQGLLQDYENALKDYYRNSKYRFEHSKRLLTI